MSFTNLITTAIDSVVDDILNKPSPTVCELGNQRLKNNKSRSKLYQRLGIHKTPPSQKHTRFNKGRWIYDPRTSFLPLG